MVKTRSMTERRNDLRACKKRAVCEEKADNAWKNCAPEERCCSSGAHAAERGCMPCVRQLHRISSSCSDLAESPISRRACVLAAREGRTEVLEYVLQNLPVEHGEDEDEDARIRAAATLVRDLIVFAAVHGHLDTMIYLHKFFGAMMLDRYYHWSTAQLCHLLAINGHVACLLFALEHGAAWPTRAEFAQRDNGVYVRSSDQAECCRIAAKKG